MEPKQILNPTEEILQFVTSFSENYKVMGTGMYHSNEDSFQVELLPYIKHDKCGRLSAVISKKNNLVKLSSDFLKNEQVTPDYVFFILIWYYSFVIFCTSKNYISIEEIDEIAISYYIKTGRSKKNLLIGFINEIKYLNKFDEYSVIRYSKINKFLFQSGDIDKF